MKDKIDIIFSDLKNEVITEKQAHQQVLDLYTLRSEIRDEMDADMEDSGMSQGEIESCLNHWSRKYIIQRKAK